MMKYEKPIVEIVLSDEEDVVTASFEIAEDEGGWSGFF